MFLQGSGVDSFQGYFQALVMFKQLDKTSKKHSNILHLLKVLKVELKAGKEIRSAEGRVGW